MRYYLFLDESGDHGLKNIDPGFPVFVLCGVLISEDKYFKFKDELNQIKQKYWRDKKVILHSRDIRKCNNEFQILFDYETKRKFYKDINTIVSNSIYTLLCSGIRKEAHIKKYGKLSDNVYEISLSFIIERSIFFLDGLKEKITDIQVVIEKRGKKEDRQLNQYFQKLKGVGTFYLTTDRIKRYGFGFHFRDKKENINGLQLADLIAYPVARYIIDPERANPAFDQIQNKFYQKQGKRFGLKIFP